jgi:hypothetical protein
MDVIQLDVPLFLRLLELSKEDIDNDADLHDIAEAVAKLSKDGPLTMADYDTIVAFMQRQGNDSPQENFDELSRIKQLGGL